jgi:hypothetical protein
MSQLGLCYILIQFVHVNLPTPRNPVPVNEIFHLYVKLYHSEASEWEARFYQIQSKYMLLLNELQTPESSQNNVRFRELIARLMGDSVTGSTPSLR